MRISITRNALAVEIVLLLVLALTVAAMGIDHDDSWHPLQLIFTDATLGASVDQDANGAIDVAENCLGKDVCTMTRLKVTGSSPGPGKVLRPDNTGLATWQYGGAASSGMIIFLNDTTCPDGWEEFTAATGRYLVGRPSGGRTGGTVGTPLTNLENRPVPKHTHTIPPTAANHTHANNYNIELYYNVTTADLGQAPVRYLEPTRHVANQAPMYTTPPSFSTAIVSPAGAGDGTTAPYVQRLICVKL